LDQERRSRMGRQIGKKVRSADAEYSLSKDTMYPKGLRGAMEKGARKKVGQAQKIMGALKSAQKEEYDIFEVVLEFLCVEGYAETLEEAEWLMANVIDEEAIEIIVGKEQLDEISQKTATRAFASRATHDFESDGADDNYTKSGKNKTDETKRRIEKKFGAAAGQHAERAAHRNIFGRGKEGFTKMPPKPTNEEFVDEAEKPFPYEKVKKKQVSLRDKGGNALDRRMQMGAAVRRAKEAEKTGGSQQTAGAGWYHAKEEYMDEAQEARNNPEKYEREQSKKYAPVRGEKTPMPPRGNKRREDFEKWYAANVR